MMNQSRISPLTAFFIGFFGVGAVGIASVSGIIMLGMGIVDSRSEEVLGFAEKIVRGTLDDLPQILETLPETIQDLLGDARVPEYAANVDIEVSFVVDERFKGLRPVMTIVNNGDRTISFMTVRVAALNGQGLPVQEWTEVVATPIGIENEWRGLLMPGNTRHVILSSRRPTAPIEQIGNITSAVEISDLRVWEGSTGS